MDPYYLYKYPRWAKHTRLTAYLELRGRVSWPLVALGVAATICSLLMWLLWHGPTGNEVRGLAVCVLAGCAIYVVIAGFVTVCGGYPLPLGVRFEADSVVLLWADGREERIKANNIVSICRRVSLVSGVGLTLRPPPYEFTTVTFTDPTGATRSFDVFESISLYDRLVRQLEQLAPQAASERPPKRSGK